MELYSVLMSVYMKENPEYFEQSVNSVLEQSYFPDQIVLVCDGPLTDELNQAIDQFSEKYPDLFCIVRLDENQGLGIALAKGLQYCRNELVARMDTDDLCVYGRFEAQVKTMMGNPELSVLGCQIHEFENTPEYITGAREVPLSHEDILKRAAFRNPMNHMSVMFRKSHVIACGNYRSAVGYEDYDLWARMLAKGYLFRNLNQCFCLVRAGSALQKRRGGWQYFINGKKMMDTLKDLQLVNEIQYVKGVCIRFVGNVLVPDTVRGYLFQKLMRKDVHHEA